MECWLATLKASSATMSDALEQTKAAWIVICKSASSTPHFLLARVQFQLVLQFVFPTYTLQLPSILYVSCQLFSKHSVPTSGNLSREKAGNFRTYQVTHLLCGLMTVPHLMSTRLMECWLATLKAFCDNVTCFGTNKSCSNSHLQECFQYSSLLQFPTCFPICLSHIHLATSLYIICFLPTVFKTFCSNKGESLTGKSWEFSDIASDTPALWAHDGTSLDVNKANGMLTSNTKGLLRQCHMLWNKQKLLE